MAEEILKMVNITKRFAGTTALDRVQFSCSKGEIHVLAGENGAGKSTILKMLAGIHQPDEGEIFFHGQKVKIPNPQQARKLGIAMVFQELTLVGEMTVWENIYLNQEPVTGFLSGRRTTRKHAGSGQAPDAGRMCREGGVSGQAPDAGRMCREGGVPGWARCLGRVDKKEIRRRIQEAMDRYGIHIDPDALVKNLPVAEQQMAEILKILVRDPELIILDEPTSALARKEVRQLYRIIRNLVADGKTIIFISHRMEEVFQLGDRITVFKDGRYIGTRNMDQISEDDLIRMMVGRSLENIFPPAQCPVDDSQVIFEVNNLTEPGSRTQGGTRLDHVSFRVYKGEILGVAGLQGQGQTELLNAISGLHPLAEGEILVGGRPVKVKNAAQAIAGGIALVPSDRKNQGLMLELSCRHNLAVASMKKRMKGCFIDRKAEEAFGRSMKERLSIKMGGLELPVSSLSGGNQQKVVLGKELATEPRVILFDEPTRGIDVEAKREFYQIMRDLAAQGVAVIMNSSDMMEVMGMSSRVLVMYEGRISGILGKEELSEERIMQLGMGMDRSEKGGAAG